MEIAATAALGFVLDIIFGDPSWIPHPIVLIGKLINGCEKFLRRVFPATRGGELAGGFFLNIIVLTVSFLLPFIVLKYIGLIDYRLRWALEIFWCWQIFALRSLKREAARVRDYVEAGDIVNARKYLGYIVGRDTGEMSKEEIEKAVIETVAENTSDGVTAPMMFVLIGGAPLGFLYKAVNTLDSMVGYKNDRYIYFGRFSAHVDDVFNFVPARLTALAMIMGAAFTGMSSGNGWKIWKRDRKKHLSPNSGNLEAACAGALGIKLGGDAYYFGRLYKKNTMGDDLKTVSPDDINRTIKLSYSASIIMLMLYEAVRILLVITL